MNYHGIKNKALALLSAIICASALLCSCNNEKAGFTIPSSSASRVIFLMSTYATINVTGPKAEDIIDELVVTLSAFEKHASMYVEGSDIDQLNRNAGNDVVITDHDTWVVLQMATQAGIETDGLFDVTIGPVTQLWGITTDHPRVPSQQEIDAALQMVDFKNLTVTEGSGETENSARLAEAGMKVDPGAIAKGYALDICRRILEERGADYAIISIGGNVFCYKDKNGTPFNVSVRYPVKDAEGYFCVLRMTDSVISTSASSERFFEQDGISYHHIIDPRTGYPAVTDIQSVSVIMQDGMRADYTSTQLFIGGLAYTLERMKSGEIDAIVVDENRQVYISKALQDSMIMEMCDTNTYAFQFV